MKTLTEPIIGLHVLSYYSVVVDDSLGLIHSAHFTMQVKIANNERSAKPQFGPID